MGTSACFRRIASISRSRRSRAPHARAHLADDCSFVGRVLSGRTTPMAYSNRPRTAEPTQGMAGRSCAVALLRLAGGGFCGRACAAGASCAGRPGRGAGSARARCALRRLALGGSRRRNRGAQLVEVVEHPLVGSLGVAPECSGRARHPKVTSEEPHPGRTDGSRRESLPTLRRRPVS